MVSADSNCEDFGIIMNYDDVFKWMSDFSSDIRGSGVEDNNGNIIITNLIKGDMVALFTMAEVYGGLESEFEPYTLNIIQRPKSVMVIQDVIWWSRFTGDNELRIKDNIANKILMLRVRHAGWMPLERYFSIPDDIDEDLVIGLVREKDYIY